MRGHLGDLEGQFHCRHHIGSLWLDAIASRVTWRAAKLLLALSPEAAKIQDVDGRAPLHYPVTNNGDAGLAELLVSSCPPCLTARDRDGKKAIDIPKEIGNEEALGVLEKRLALKCLE